MLVDAPTALCDVRFSFYGLKTGGEMTINYMAESDRPSPSLSIDRVTRDA